MPQEQITPEQPDLDDDIYDDDLDLAPVYPEDFDDSEIVHGPIVRKEVKTPKKGPADALASIAAGEAKAVAYGLKGYKGLTSEVATALMDAGQGGAVLWYPDKFEGLDHDATILRLVSDKEADLERREQELLDLGFSPYHYKVKELSDRRQYRGILQNINRFELKPETLDALEERGFRQTVASYRAGAKPGRGITKNQRLNRALMHLNEHSR